MKDGQDSPTSKLVAPNVFCRACDSPLVQAVDWDKDDDSLWRVRLWCPECGFDQAATLERSQLLLLSLAVEEGFVWLLEALSELSTLSLDPDSIDFVHRAQTDRIRPALR